MLKICLAMAAGALMQATESVRMGIEIAIWII